MFRSLAKKGAPYLFLVLWLGIVAVIYIKQQSIVDWWKLRSYTPPAAVVKAADQTTMTASARRLWYVNKPVIAEGESFGSNCPLAVEKTVILGCYKSDDGGIYVYKVSDERLSGVIEVTAAHEMLHAAYDRLSKGERQRIDVLLQDYYDQGLSDQRVKDTIDAYQKSEPHALKNEMHSIFATEIAKLPTALETYYSRYFTKRSTVVVMTDRYQAEFTTRKQAVARYDAELKALKSTIEDSEQTLERQKAAIDAEGDRLDRLRAANVTAYNAAVDGYNRMIGSYNTLLESTRAGIDQYNGIVEKRNAVALEQRELTQALSGQRLPAPQ